MQPWLMPMLYASGAVVAGLALLQIERGHTSALSVASAQALLSAAASGMTALATSVAQSRNALRNPCGVNWPAPSRPIASVSAIADSGC